MKFIAVYQGDQSGFFMYESKAYELALQPGSFNVPYGALIVKPENPPQGYVARINIDGDGWDIIEDPRRDE
jgi:hypothetical protein